MRVLVVEDEVSLAEAIQEGLRRESIAADTAFDGAMALEAVSITEYDIVILDRDIPVVQGDEVCRLINADFPDVRVLMLSAARALDDRVGGLAVGADDYLAKPFEFPELVARLRALDRRKVPASQPVLEASGLRLDSFRREVHRDGRYVSLSRKQFAILELLMQARGGVISAETLLEKAWDENADPFTNAIRVTISTLRKRLGLPQVIITVPGVGYKIDVVNGD